MTKTKILLILIIIGVVLVSIYVFYKVVLLPQMLLKEAIIQTVKPGKTIKTLSECEKIANEMEKFSCYKDIATDQQDTLICDKISNPDETMEKVYQEMCYTSVAAAKKDISICEKMSNQGSKEKCYAGVAQDPSVCEKIQERTFKDNCYEHLALEKENPSFCEKVVVTELGKDFCYKEVAVRKKDASICDKITDRGVRENCLFLIEKGY